MKRIIALVLSLALIAATLLLSACGNKEPQKFNTPEEHFEYVAEKSAKTYLSSGLQQYNTAIEQFTGKSLSYSLKVELGTDLTSMLSSLVNSMFSSSEDGINLTTLKDIEAKVHTSTSGNLANASLGLLINGKEIIVAELQLNSEKKTVAAKIPVISDEYYTIVEEQDFDKIPELSSFGTVLSELKTELPTDEEITTIVMRYLGMLLKKAKDGVESEEEYKVGSLTEKARCVTSVFSFKTVSDFAKEALTALKDDADVLAIIERNAEEGKKAEAKQEYQKMIDTELQKLNEKTEGTTLSDDEKLEVKFFTNKNNEILGVRVNVNRTDDTGAAKTASVTAGFLTTKDKYALSVEVKEGDEVKATVDSEGTYNNGKISGVINVKVGDAAIPVTVKDLDVKAVETGKIPTGSISVSIADILSIVNTSNPGQTDLTTLMILNTLSSYSLVYEYTTAGELNTLTTAIKNESKTFLAISESAEVKSSTPVTEVTTAKSHDEFLDHMSKPETMSGIVDKVSTSLKEAGLDEKLVSLLSGLFFSFDPADES